MQPVNWPNTTNYFLFYQLPLQYKIDLSGLKAKYFEYAKQFHPDFFTQDTQSQGKALEISAINNRAFKILNNAISRLQYLLELKNISLAENSTLPQSFLMEMMELNEQIDEIDFADNKIELATLIANDIKATQATMLNEIYTLAENNEWEKAKENLLKWRYLERLQERVSIN